MFTRRTPLPRKKILRIILLCLIVLLFSFILFTRKSFAPNTQANEQSGTTATPNSSTQSTPLKVFDKSQNSNDDPASIWVVVNKLRPLQPKTYKPTDLRIPNVSKRPNATSDEIKMRDQAATALEQMFAAASNEGVSLLLASGYRSYNLQVGVYNRNVRNVGQAEADIRSARPGHSEHQSGLSVDVGAASRQCEIEECFANLAEGKWVATNAHRFGFIIRYPQGKQGTTGYVYEPWHIRFVGSELAAELLKDGNPTLEEFFSLPNAPTY